MGAGKSRLNAKQCSKVDVKNDETQNVIVSTHNSRNASDKNVRSQNVSNFSVKENNDFNCVRQDVKRTRLKRNCDNVYGRANVVENDAVNNAVECKYSLEPLTAEQQLEEIKKVFQEKTRAKAGEIPANLRRSPKRRTPPTTCCNCNCNCERTKKLSYQVEQRNGLQNLRPLGNEACRCSMCNGRMGELSEAEAIANAIAQYCCRDRKRTQAEANKSGRCCKCNGKVQAARNWQQHEMESDDEEDFDTDEEIEAEIEIDCCCPEHNKSGQERGTKCCKCSTETRQRKRESFEMEFEDKEVIEEEDMIDEEYVVKPAKQHRDEPRGSDPPHAKGCRCCDCKTKQKATELSDEEEISIEDIELEIQEIRNENPRTPSTESQQSQRLPASTQRSESKPIPRSNVEEESQDSGRKKSIQSHANYCKCSNCKKNSEKSEIVEEKEVLMKNINLEVRSKESIKGKRERVPAKDLPLRRESNRSDEQQTSIHKTGDREDRAHGRDCKCCDCRERNPPAESLMDKMEIDIITESARGEQDKRPRRSLESETENSRDHSRVRQERLMVEKGDILFSRDKRKHETTSKDQQSHHHDNRDSYASNGRRGSVVTEGTTEATAAQQRRRLDKYKAHDHNQEYSHGRDCSCCDCKQKFTVAEKKSQIVEEEEAEIETEDQQNCCCFTARRSHRKSSEGDAGASNCCKCRKEGATDKRRRSSDATRTKKSQQQRDKVCEKDCSCKKKKGVPLTKCCRCNEDAPHESVYADSKQRHREEDRRRRKLAEELADRLQRRAELQIGLQKRLQDQLKSKQKQRCCCDPPPCCYPQYPCCEPRCESMPMSCCEPTACCFPPPPCCYPPASCCFPQQPSPCCYDPQPCYGQECPCCCQPMPYCYAASCNYGKSGSCA